MHARRVRLLLLPCTLLIGPLSVAWPQLSISSGTWTATVGQDRPMRGRWIGRMIPGEPDSAHGSWTMIDKSGRTVMKGTWSAHKVGNAWQGTWSAQNDAQRAAQGSWKADAVIDPKNPLHVMLELQEVSGTWKSGRLSGYWWLQGKPALSK